MNKAKAREECSKYGESVHLPIPRFAEENKFYQKHFGKRSLWLDISYEDSDGLTSASGHSFTAQVQTAFGSKDYNKYKWINSNITNKFDNHEVIMTKNGQWLLIDENESIDSICVYNIVRYKTCLIFFSPIFAM